MDSMLALLVADDPRRSADRILTRLIQIHQAQGGAILRPSGGQVEIWLSAGLNLGAVSELPVRWADHREALEAGRRSSSAGYALLPPCSARSWWQPSTSPSPWDRPVADARLFGTAIAQAVLASTAGRGTVPRPGSEPHRGGPPAAPVAPRAPRVEHRGGGPAAERARAAPCTCACAASASSASGCPRSTRRCRSKDDRSPARRRPRDEARAPRPHRGDRVARAGEAVRVVRALCPGGPPRERPRLLLAGRFFTPSFWVLKQGVYDVLKMAIALELALRAFVAFPGAARTARVVDPGGARGGHAGARRADPERRPT